MTTVVAPKRHYAEMILKLLWKSHGGSVVSQKDWDHVEWAKLVQLVSKNAILVRTHESVIAAGVSKPSDQYTAVVRQEAERVKMTVELMVRLHEICATADVKYVYTKAFQHYPDMGHDIDLFVGDRSRRPDAALRQAFGDRMTERSGSLLNRISGKMGYRIEGFSSPLEIHHGRLGHFGEHREFASLLLENRREHEHDGNPVFVPRLEDSLIVQALQRIFGHRYIRISDIVGTVAAVREGTLDWDYITATSREAGVLGGVSCYLSYVEQIYQGVMGQPFLPAVESLQIQDRRWGRPAFDGSYYRFPVGSVLGRAYSEKIWNELHKGNWECVGKLSLLPPVACHVTARALARRGIRLLSRRSDPRGGASES